MNESLVNEEINKATNTQKLFGLPRPIAGMLIGILTFLFIETIFRVLFFYLFILLLSPGFIIQWTMFPALGWSDSISVMITYFVVIFGISSIFPGILGWLMVSHKKETRVTGVILAIIYFIVLLVIGIPILPMFD